MTPEQQIAAVRTALAAVETAIGQTETALQTATPRDRLSLTAVLVDLRAERAKLKFQLANLEAAAVAVQPVGVMAAVTRGARRGRASAVASDRADESGAATTAPADRRAVLATLRFAKDVTRLAKSVGASMEQPVPTKRAKGSTKRPSR
jgi:hypothetical protein